MGGAKTQQNLKWVPKAQPGAEKAEKPFAEKKPGKGKGKAFAEKAKPAIADPMIFLGRWKDSLGNLVEVEQPASSSEKDKVQDAGVPPPLLAKLTRKLAKDAEPNATAPEPRILKIIVDPRMGRWRCGNGVLDRLGYKGSGNNLPTALSWMTQDGRVSTWAKMEEKKSAEEEEKKAEQSAEKPSEENAAATEEGTQKAAQSVDPAENADQPAESTPNA